MNKFFRKYRVTAVVVAVLLAGVYFYFGKNKNEPAQAFAIAEIKDIEQIVGVTGRVNPASSIDLAFEKSGKIKRIYADVGSQVFAGQTIIELENGDAAASLAAAKASLKAAEAKLAELKAGARIEELAIAETKVKNAVSALDDAKKNLVDKIFDAYTKSDDAVRNKADQLFSNPKSSSPQVNFPINGVSLENNIELGRYAAETALTDWQGSLASLNIAVNLSSYMTESGNNLEIIKNLLEKISLAVNALVAGPSLSQTIIDGWKGDISIARTNINTAIGNLSAANEKFRNSLSALALSQNELALTKAGSTPEAISQQEASVEKEAADVAASLSALSKTIITSPVNGTVYKMDADAGEIVQASAVIAGVISNTKFKIEADVPEADIAKLHIGDGAKVTLDAYGNGIFFNAKIVSIDPAEKIIDGVATYRTTLQFTAEDPRIKSGMTANIDISTAKKIGAVSLPARTIFTKNNKKYVTVALAENKTEEREIQTGIQGVDGSVEIISGLQVGEKVLIPKLQ